MTDLDVEGLLRPGLLDGSTIALAAAAEAARVSGRGLAGLGAVIVPLSMPEASDPQQLQEATEAAVREAIAAAGAAPDMLVVDAAPVFAADGAEGLERCMAAVWSAVRAVAGAAFLPEAGGTGGRIVLLAPAAGPEHAGAAAAGLENLARTLSIEWARFNVTIAAIAPGAGASGQQLTALVAYLASAAGAYFSGCLLDLRGSGAARES